MAICWRTLKGRYRRTLSCICVMAIFVYIATRVRSYNNHNAAVASIKLEFARNKIVSKTSSTTTGKPTVTMSVVPKNKSNKLIHDDELVKSPNMILIKENSKKRQLVPKKKRCQEIHDRTHAMTLFSEAIKPSEKEQLRSLMKVFSEAVTSKVSYLMYGYTLRGSYFHHGMVPWDDDIDLVVKEGDKQILKTLLLNTTYALHTRETIWKFYNKSSIPTTSAPWRWPFLDIFFYSLNLTHFIKLGNGNTTYKRHDIFPLVERPFMGMMLPAPRNVEKILSRKQDLSICKKTCHNHKTRRKRDEIPVLPCEFLTSTFPFVRREIYNNRTVEILEIP
ncbi:uncharacterized protein [Haliotis cracherodii]|uniref:uncharacterized protein n=1 Tax=Haliotis cracherodii TaxID=6455 RepID=UPI0039E932D6